MKEQGYGRLIYGRVAEIRRNGQVWILETVIGPCEYKSDYYRVE